MKRLFFLVATAATLGASCDWREFDLEDTAPVVLLNPSQGVRGGFGRSVVGTSDGTRSMVLVGGAPGGSEAAVYSIGKEQSPSADASPGAYCSPTNRASVDPCVTADRSAAIPMDNASRQRDICFAYGWGTAKNGQGAGLIVRCQDSSDIPLRVADGVVKARDRRFNMNGEHQPLFIAGETVGDLAEAYSLVAALPKQQTAWYYPPPVRLSTVPVPLQLPGDAKRPTSFGSQVAVLRLGKPDTSARLMAVAAPVEGQVWFFRSGADAAGRDVTPVGCFGSRQGFGRTLATGRVNADEFDDLVIAENGVVTVFSGAALDQLPEAFTAECSLSGLPSNAVIASFTCGSRLALSGCEESEFGASLAVGDLDGDGDGEVLVGAPGMKVFGESEAGSVLVYDAEGNAPHALTDVLYISSAEARDRLGHSVTAVRQKKSQKESRDVVVAGAPGNGKTAVFLCSALLPEKALVGRCAP